MSAQSRLDESIKRINATALAELMPITSSTIEGPTIAIFVKGKGIKFNEVWINCSNDKDIDKMLRHELIYYSLGRRMGPEIAEAAFKCGLQIEPQ